MTAEKNLDELDPRERAELIRKAIYACDLCDDEGYNPGGPFLVCDHNADRTEINKRGMALVRKALEGKPNNPDVLRRHTVADELRRRETGPLLSGNPTVADPEPEL